MANHGGFGIAVQLSDRFVNDVLLVLQRSDIIPKTQRVQSEVPGGAIDLDLYIDAPVASFTPNSGGDFDLRVRTFGTLVIDAPDVDPAPRKVRIDLVGRADLDAHVEQILNPLTIDVADWIESPFHYDLVANFSDIGVSDNTFTVVDGDDLPVAWKAFFVSTTFRIGVGVALATALASVRSVIPPDLAPILNEIDFAGGASIQLQTIVGDGFITFGGDVTDTQHGIATEGVSADVERFIGDSDVGLIVSDALKPLLRNAMRRAINASTDAATVTSLTLGWHDGHFSVQAHAEAAAGDADLSFKALPKLQKPGWTEHWDDEYGQQYAIEHPAEKRVWLDIQDFHIETSLDPGVWVGLIFGGVIAGGLFLGPQHYAMVAHAIVRDIVTGIGVRVVEQGQATIFDPEQSVRLAGTSFPIAYRIQSLQVHEDRIQCIAKAAMVKTNFGRIVGPGSVAIRALDQTLVFAVQPAAFHRYDPTDPEPKAKWTVWRKDNAAIVRTEVRALDDPQSHELELNLAHFGAGHQGIDAYELGFRVTRELEGEEEHVFSAKDQVSIVDRLDRGHDYVRWKHLVVTPDVVVHPDGSQQRVGKRVFTRQSRIHRTRWPGRCAFADRYAGDKDLELEYLDKLPFPLAELNSHRGQVCDYCFFGGPDKDESLVKEVKPPGGGFGDFGGIGKSMRTVRKRMPPGSFTD